MANFDTQKVKDALTIKKQGGKGSGNYGHEGRPGKVGGSASKRIGKAGSDLFNKLLESGGFTYQPIYEISPATGFMVSPYSDREKVIETTSLSDKDIADYIINNRDLLQKQDHYLGGWLYEGNCYLDISIRLESQSEANRVAKENNQIAFFDLDSMSEIKTNALQLKLMKEILMQNKKKVPITFTGPKDKSLESFTAWLKQTSEKLNAKTTMTDSEIKSAWEKFWKK